MLCDALWCLYTCFIIAERLSSQHDDTQREQHLAAIADIERRFEAVEIADQREDTACFVQTLAFTHPDTFPHYSSYPSMPNLLLWAVAVEAAKLSEEVTERCYFGHTKELDVHPFTKKDLTLLLNGANALWFGTADIQTSSEQQNGFNHIIGIVPYRSPYDAEPTFMVHDTSGHIGFEPQTIDELYVNLDRLPHSDQYMQSVFAFRERGLNDSEDDFTGQEFRFFTPPSSPQ